MRRRDVAVDVLDDDHRTVDDDPEVDRADREQVGRLTLQIEHCHREQERQRDHDRNDARARQVAEEHEQDEDHQRHADDEVVDHIVGRDVHQVGPLVEDAERHALGQDARLLDRDHLLGHGLGRGQRLLVLPHQDDALDDVVLVLEDVLAPLVDDRVVVLLLERPADLAQPRLVVDDGGGNLADVDRHALVVGDQDVADLVELVGLDREGLRGVGWVERILGLADQAERADVVRLRAEREHVAADVGVRLAYRVLDLLERDAVLAEEPRVEPDLVLLDLAAVARHVDDARHRLEGPLEDPVLDRLELLGRVAGPLDDVADDLSRRAPGRELGRHAGRDVVDRIEPVDDLLAGGPVIGAVLEHALDVVQPGDGGAADVVEPGDADQRRLERDADQPLHLLRAGAGVLGDDLDQGRGGVRVGLDVEVVGGVRSEADQAEHAQEHNEPVVQAPGNDRANHGIGALGRVPESRGGAPAGWPGIRMTAARASERRPTRREID